MQSLGFVSRYIVVWRTSDPGEVRSLTGSARKNCILRMVAGHTEACDAHIHVQVLTRLKLRTMVMRNFPRPFREGTPRETAADAKQCPETVAFFL